MNNSVCQLTRYARMIYLNNVIIREDSLGCLAVTGIR